MKKIAVESGHRFGNIWYKPFIFDPGACGLVREADQNLILASLINIKFLYDSYKTLPIRVGGIETSCSLGQGIKRANKEKCDAYISVHMNSDEAHLGEGWEIWCGADKIFSRTLAASIFEELDKSIGNKMKFRGVKETNNLAVCRDVLCPSVLIELGFVWSPSDVECVKHISFLNSCARAIVNGTKNFLNIK